MVFYLLLFLFVLICLLCLKITKNDIFFLLAFVVLFVVSAIRFDIGKDFSTYYQVVLGNTYRFIAEYERFEPLNKFLINISRFLDFPQFYFIATSFLTFILIYIGTSKFSLNKKVSLLVFLSFPIFYISTFSAVRQYVAVAIVFFSFKYIFERNFLKFTLIIFLASLFHSSAILSLIMYPLYKMKFSKKIMLFLLIVTPITSNLINSILKSLFPINYLFYNDFGQGRKILLIIGVILLISILFRERLSEIDAKSNFYLNSLLVGYCIMSILLQNSDMGTRLGVYFVQVIILLIPLYSRIFTEKKLRIVINYAIYCLCIWLFIFTLMSKVVTPEATQIVPYKTFFNHGVNEMIYD